MKKKKRLFVEIGISLSLLIGTVTVGYMSFNKENVKKSEIATVQQNLIGMNLSEERVSYDKIGDYSDAIIKGIVEKFDESTVQSFDTKDGKGEKISVEIPYSLYDVKVLETIKDKQNIPRNIKLVIADQSMNLEVGKTYALAIRKIKGTTNLAGSYTLVSLSQGIFEVMDDNQEIMSLKMQERMRFKDFKQLVTKQAKQ